MITGRSILIAAILVSTLSLLSITWNLDSESSFELGRNSLGLRSQGQRALYETLEELNLGVRRRIDPPSQSQNIESTLVFLEPDKRMIEIEPVYISKTAEWVESGGHVLYAAATSEPLLPSMQQRDPSKPPGKTFLELIGIGKAKVSRWNVELSDGSGPPEIVPASSTNTERPVGEQLQSVYSPTTMSIASLAVECRGEWASLAGDVTTICLPQQSNRLYRDFPNANTRPIAEIVVPRSDGEPLTLAAMFRYGKGTVTVLSDATLAHNGFFANDDNAVALVNLLAGRGEVVFDEFYHGLIPRGNPMVLLRRPLFTVLIAMICLSIGAYAWRHGVRLGPAIDSLPSPRRSLQEYVEAMSRLFSKSRGRARFLLEENRKGLVWTLQSELGMTGSKDVEGGIIRVLKRRQPERAQRVAECLEQFDRTLRQNHITDRDAIDTTRRIQDCL